MSLTGPSGAGAPCVRAPSARQTCVAPAQPYGRTGWARAWKTPGRRWGPTASPRSGHMGHTPETHWWSPDRCPARVPAGRPREAGRPGSHVICPHVSDTVTSSRSIDGLCALTRWATNHSQPHGSAHHRVAIPGGTRGPAGPLPLRHVTQRVLPPKLRERPSRCPSFAGRTAPTRPSEQAVVSHPGLTTLVRTRRPETAPPCANPSAWGAPSG